MSDLTSYLTARHMMIGSTTTVDFSAVGAGVRRLDVPKAPELLGRLLGHCFLEGALSMSVLPELCEPIEGAEPRRALVAAALKYVKVHYPPLPFRFPVLPGSVCSPVSHIVSMCVCVPVSAGVCARAHGKGGGVLLDWG